jgi:glycosyltransferase involved in cell wall biosynthesis
MRLSEDGRYWKFNLNDLSFDYYIDNGFYKKLSNTYHFHFNPEIIKKIIKSDAEIILGGSWNDINVMLLCLLKRAGLLKNKMHIWSEANYMTIGASHDNFIKYSIRQFVFNAVDGNFIIPGKISELTFERWGIKNKNFIYFPNLINNEYYSISSEEDDERYNAVIPKMLIVASLNEPIKGVFNFIKSIGILNLKKIALSIAGDGPDKEQIIKYINENNLKNNICLLGHLSQDDILSEYKKANIFILPSFSDPSPLSIVEALYMRLPLLISNRCGNHYEALIEGENGFSFDPYDSDSITDAFNRLLSRREIWKQMGEKSFIIADTKFKPTVTLSNFLNKIIK